MFEAGHVKPASCWADIGTRGEVKIFSIFVEAGKACIAETVSHLNTLVRLERVDVHHAESVSKLFCISYPSTIRRPAWIHNAVWILVCIRIDLDRISLIDIHKP